MFGKKEKIEKVIEEVTKSASIPFLEREKSITDLESLMERVTNLTTQTKKSNEQIKGLEYKIKKLESGIKFISMDTGAYSGVCVDYSDCPEAVELFRQSLIAAYKSKIERENGLIHTCQNELDWLQMKVGMGSPVLKNKFDSGDFNFDPNKDHC